MTSAYEALAERLDQVVADLDEMSYDVVADAVSSGATHRPLADRRLTQARRAAEKAAHLLRTLDQARE